jgi:hypothetical protein
LDFRTAFNLAAESDLRLTAARNARWTSVPTWATDRIEIFLAAGKQVAQMAFRRESERCDGR